MCTGVPIKPRQHPCLFPSFLLFAEGAAVSPTNQTSEASIPRSVGSDDQSVEAGDEGEGKEEEEERQEEVGIEDQIDGNDDEVISDDFLSSSSSLSSPPRSPPTVSEKNQGELYFMQETPPVERFHWRDIMLLR